MSQDEPQDTPKNKPKVEPLDRRGKRFKEVLGNRKVDIPLDEATASGGIKESETQRLDRLKSDRSANHEDLCNTLRHFLPHIQLIEIEKLLRELVARSRTVDVNIGFYNLLTLADELKLMDSELIEFGHKIRKIRNNLFHHNNLVRQYDDKLIDDFWSRLRAITTENETSVVRIKKAIKSNPKSIIEVQKVAEEICEVALFIDIELLLRRTLAWMLKRDTELSERFKILPNGEIFGPIHAYRAIKSSNNAVAQSLRKLRFIDSIKESIDCRNDVLHGRIEKALSKKELTHIRRTWSVLQNLPYALRAFCLIVRLEKSIKELLISEGCKINADEKLPIDKLAERLCIDEGCMSLLSQNGVSKHKILGLTELNLYKLSPPLSADVENLRELCVGVQNTLNSQSTDSETADYKSRKNAHKGSLHRRKHKSGRDHDDFDDYS